MLGVLMASDSPEGTIRADCVADKINSTGEGVYLRLPGTGRVYVHRVVHLRWLDRYVFGYKLNSAGTEKECLYRFPAGYEFALFE